ncbi:DUF937 domain-containing protein [Flavobacterium paronense]|uniref:DUF937 domain-containing protein n=1 Tax=Flavobacterium paronense TaxID=1392775 RepID=UPI0025B2EDC3|nr:DUF937 domain-containing protein [Flavobacterium paronense]MDN3675904.1 DUF937 domain-containing protein [Flavobacterium paronense]
MFEQLTDLVKQFGSDAVVNNAAVPNEHNEAVMNEASSSILDSLKGMVASGNVSDLAGLFQGDNASDGSNPVVKQLTDKLSGSLGEKFGLDSEAASGVAGSLIPKVLGSLVNKAKDPNDSSFQISDIINAVSGGDSQTSGGIMDAISKYGGQFGLDQDGDGQVGISDAVAAVSKNLEV